MTLNRNSSLFAAGVAKRRRLEIKSKLAAVAMVGMMAASAQAALVVYEPFNYTTGNLNGNGGAELGLTGTWTASTSAGAETQVQSGSLAYGSLITAGNRVGFPAGGVNRFGGTRSVDPLALAGNGLLNDGAVLWFSLEMGYDTPVNATNARLSFALANSRFNAGNGAYRIDDEGLQLGEGLGVTLGRFGTNGRVAATEFQDLSQGTGVNGAGNIVGTSAPAVTLVANTAVHTLVVGRFTWGAASDTIDIFLPDTLLNLGSVVSTLNTSVNQAAFDTITFARGEHMMLDEIRFGASFADVTPVPVPEIAVSGNTLNIVNGDNTPSLADGTDFGPVELNALATETFTINNTGTAALTLSAPIFTGDFSLLGLFPVSIAPGGSATFDVLMNTATLGPKFGTISFANNDADENPFIFSLSGTATPEPASIAIWTLLGLGLVGFGCCRIRRRK